MNPLTPYLAYIKWGLIALALILGVRWVYGKGYDAAELHYMKANARLIEGEVKHRVAADKALADALHKIPPTGQRVNDAVRDHPTSPDCRVPDAAADALQQGIAASAANAAD